MEDPLSARNSSHVKRRLAPRVRELAATILVLAASAAVSVATASDEQAPNPVSVLRAEIAADRTLFRPAHPLPIRFTLFNPTDQPVEIPGVGFGAGEAGIMLPTSLVIGTIDEPTLLLAFENEAPVPIRAPSQTTAPATDPDTFRLAPHASIGTQLDLAELHRSLRYSGSYVLEWRPLNGQVPPVTFQFTIEPRKDVVLVTDYGNITFSLLYDQAPRNVENFAELVRDRFYDGKTFHRVIPDFILQGGAPDGDPTGLRPDGKTVAAEFSDVPFDLGTLAMARRPSKPDSASCQFFISLARNADLDGKYTVIGKASDKESLRTLQRLAELPTDTEGRPLRPLVTRFVTLVDVEPTPERAAKSDTESP